MKCNNIFRWHALGIAFDTLVLVGLLLIGTSMAQLPPPPGGGGGGGGGCGGGGGGRVITVDDSGGANYTRIQDAIDNASAGDTILVYNGTYYENVNVNKQLILRGSCSGKPVVDGGGNARAITISADGVVLEGFKAMNAPYLYGSGTGIYVQSNNNTIKNNTVSDNNYAGIYLASTSYYSDTLNNTLSYNIVSNNGAGIYLYYSSNNVLTDNNVSSNRDHGIVLWPSSNNTLIRNTVNTNGLDGISLGYSSDNIIVGNTASNNPVGISLDFSSNNNLIYDNFFNNINNIYSAGTINTWNITKTPGTNIIGGPYLGGNFWAHPNGTGFSQTCTDEDRDGICDSAYVLDRSNIDYLPLSTGSAAYQIILEPAAPVVNDPLTVTVLKNGSPEPGILVQFVLNGGTPVLALTDSQGKARFVPLEAGNLVITAKTMDGVPLANISVSVAPAAKPTVSISTDKMLYIPGETVQLTLNISNPTANSYPSRLALDIIWPTGAGMNLITKSFTMPPGLRVTKTIPYLIPNSILIPDGDYSFNATLTYGSNTTGSEAAFVIRRR